jgi:hypothetical protein
VYLFLLSDYDDDDRDDNDDVDNNNHFPYLKADGTALGPSTKPLIHK